MAELNKDIVDFTKKFEGGYVNHPCDRGGCTNMGVTIATFRQFYGRTKTCEDLKKLTDEQWMKIYRKGYWDRWKADQIECQSIAHLLVDWVWGSGIYGIKYPQQVLGVTADGIVGPKTLAAINKYPDQKELFQKLWNRRKKHFEDIVKRNPSQKVFIKGWLNRLNALKWKG
jgi:lysozyme family protein